MVAVTVHMDILAQPVQKNAQEVLIPRVAIMEHVTTMVCALAIGIGTHHLTVEPVQLE